MISFLKEGDSMQMFEYTKKENLKQLSPDQQHFIAKIIMNDVQQIARGQNISESLAYEMYAKGLYGGDRTIGTESELCAKLAQSGSGEKEFL